MSGWLQILVYGGAAVGLLGMGMLAMYLIVKSGLPIPDLGNTIIPYSSIAERDAFAAAITRATGKRPRWRIGTGDVQRVMMSDGTLLNYTDPELYAEMGRPTMGRSWVVENPHLAAIRFVNELELRGLNKKDVTLLRDPDKDVAEGAMYFVVAGGVTYVFRKHGSKMGQKMSRYRPQQGA